MKADSDTGIPSSQAGRGGSRARRGTSEAQPEGGRADLAALHRAVASQTRTLEHLEATVDASASRVEQALQGLAMRVDLLESSFDDSLRALRELQSAVASLPPAITLEPAAMERWSEEHARAVAGVEAQLSVLSGQMEALRRRIPLRGRPGQAG